MYCCYCVSLLCSLISSVDTHKNSLAMLIWFCFATPHPHFFFYGHNSDGWKPACIWHRRWPGTFKSSSVVTATIKSKHLRESLPPKSHGNRRKDAIQQNNLNILQINRFENIRLTSASEQTTLAARYKISLLLPNAWCLKMLHHNVLLNNFRSPCCVWTKVSIINVSYFLKKRPKNWITVKKFHCQPW